MQFPLIDIIAIKKGSTGFESSFIGRVIWLILYFSHKLFNFSNTTSRGLGDIVIGDAKLFPINFDGFGLINK